MDKINTVLLASGEEIEEVLEHNIDDIYRVLSSCSETLKDISGKLDVIENVGQELLQLLQESFLDSIAALLLILVCFEIKRLVRGWTKGERING